MRLLPIVSRELSVAARRLSTFNVRFAAVLIAFVLMAWQLIAFAQSNAPAGTQGPRLFHTLAALAFVYCLFIGAHATADCLSEEKREGTLGLLFLTDLRGYDVVFGKLVARSLSALYGLLAFLPVLALSLLMGGVTGFEFWAMAAVLLNTLFLSLCCGVLVSTLSRNDRKAMFATGALICATALGPFFVVMSANEYLGMAVDFENAWLITAFSPLHALAQLRYPTVPWPEHSFLVSLALVHLVAWSMLLRACAIVPGFARERVPRPKAVEWRRRLAQWGAGTLAQQRQFRDRLLEANPFLWLSVRTPVKLHHAWGLFGAMLLGWWIGYLRHGDVMLDANAVLPTVFLFHSLIKIWITAEASHRIAEDRNSGALELLLSTPLKVSAIVHGQWLAVRRQFFWPVVMAISAELLLLTLAGPLRWIGQETDVRAMLVAMMIMLVADLFTLGWVAMWTGLVARSHTRAILDTIALVMVLPWMIYFTSTTVVPPPVALFTVDRLQVLCLLWVLIGITVDLVLVFAWARPRLLRTFRSAALQRYRLAPADAARFAARPG